MDKHNNPGWPSAAQNTNTGHRQSNTPMPPSNAGTRTNTGNRPPLEHMQNVVPYRGHGPRHQQPQVARQYHGYEGYYDGNNPNMAHAMEQQQLPNIIHTRFASPATGLAHPHQHHLPVNNAPLNTIDHGDPVYGQPLGRHPQVLALPYAMQAYSPNQYASPVYQNPPDGGHRYGHMSDANANDYTNNWHDGSLANSQAVGARTVGAARPSQEAPRQAAADIPQPTTSHGLSGSNAAVDRGNGDDGEACKGEASSQPEATHPDGQQDEASNQPEAIQSVSSLAREPLKEIERHKDFPPNLARGGKYDECSNRREHTEKGKVKPWAIPENVYDTLEQIKEREHLSLEDFELADGFKVTYNHYGQVNEPGLSSRHVRAIMEYKIDLAEQEEEQQKAEQEAEKEAEQTVKQEVTEEVKQEVTEEVKQEVTEEVKQEVKQEFKKKQLKGFKMWIQNPPSQSNHRLINWDNICRWKHCGRIIAATDGSPCTIRPGSIRVAFDEFPALTSTKNSPDPLKPALVFHLWCFERIFSRRKILELLESKYLAPDFRPSLGREDRHLLTLAKDGRKGGNEVIGKWEQWKDDKLKEEVVKMIRPAIPNNEAGEKTEQKPLNFNDDHLLSLTCLLNLWYADKIPEHRIKNGTGTRVKGRDIRNNKIPSGATATFDYCLGDRRLVERTSKARRDLGNTVEGKKITADNKKSKTEAALKAARENEENATRKHKDAEDLVKAAKEAVESRQKELEAENATKPRASAKRLEAAKKRVDKAQNNLVKRENEAQKAKNRVGEAGKRVNEAAKKYNEASQDLDAALKDYEKAGGKGKAEHGTKKEENKEPLQILGEEYEQVSEPGSPVAESESTSTVQPDKKEKNEGMTASPAAITSPSVSPRVKKEQEEEDPDPFQVPGATGEGSSAAAEENLLTEDNRRDCFDGCIKKDEHPIPWTDDELEKFLDFGDCDASQTWDFSDDIYLREGAPIPEAKCAEPPQKRGWQDISDCDEYEYTSRERRDLQSVPGYKDDEDAPEAKRIRIEAPQQTSGAAAYHAYAYDLDKPTGTKRRADDNQDGEPSRKRMLQ